MGKSFATELGAVLGKAVVVSDLSGNFGERAMAAFRYAPANGSQVLFHVAVRSWPPPHGIDSLVPLAIIAKGFIPGTGSDYLRRPVRRLASRGSYPAQ